MVEKLLINANCATIGVIIFGFRITSFISRSKDNRQEKTFEALDWLAAMASHIPGRGIFENLDRLFLKV